MRATSARLRTTHARIIDARKNKALAEKEIARCIRSGAVIVYPTDTVYGIGCDAGCARAVRRIRSLKNRFAKPFSVIAPSKQWIRENCFLSPPAAEFLAEKMPGPYTMILRLKNKRCVSRETNAGRVTLGVRLPRHWIADVVREAGVPLVTTSVNKSGEPPARTLRELKEFGADLIVFEGVKRGRPSTIVDFSGKKTKIKAR